MVKLIKGENITHWKSEYERLDGKKKETELLIENEDVKKKKKN